MGVILRICTVEDDPHMKGDYTITTIISLAGLVEDDPHMKGDYTRIH